LLAHHYTEAEQIDKAATLWGKAGQRSLERSALIEGIEQLTRALDQINTLTGTPALRREEIKLQVALISPLVHVKGYAAPQTKAAAERAHLLIEKAKARGEPPEDPLILFSVLYGAWVVNHVAFNGDVVRELATQFLALAENQGAAVPRMIGHRLMGTSLLCTGDVVESRVHFNQALAFFDPVEHRSLAARFGQDVGVAIFSYRSLASWMLGYPSAALDDAEEAVKNARKNGQAGTLMFALLHAIWFHLLNGTYAAAAALVGELVALADEKGALFWKHEGIAYRGVLFALSEKTPEAVHLITSGIDGMRSTHTTLLHPWCLSHLAKAYAELGQFDDARHSIDGAKTMINRYKETWFETDVYRISGEIELKSSESETALAEACFRRALAVARHQQAKSWELRAAMSLARLWRDQGKREEARELVAPVYGCFLKASTRST
jgi:predicted ATPase